MAILRNTTISDTGFLTLPVGTTAQRPSPAAGQLRYNTNTGKAEFYNSAEAAWINMVNRGVIATGGTVYDTDVEGTAYRVHVFINTGNSTFTVTKAGPVEYLIVAGGGGGSGNFYDDGAGGGAGGLVTGTATVTAQAYTVTVGGGGGTGNPGGDGGNSVAFGSTAIGGGGGAQHRGPGRSGGSGGGGAGRYGSGDNVSGGAAQQPSSASGGFGNAGGGFTSQAFVFVYPHSSGGGGAGSVGELPAGSGGPGGAGGIGFSTSISGISNFYAGGGGGLSLGLGGLGGGARATTGRGGSPALAATPNTGGGGGGGRGSGDPGAPSNGGSGIVIIRYPLRQENPVTAAGKVVGDALVLDLDFAKPTVYVGTGTVVTDSRLNGITGTLNNGPVFTDSRTHRSAFRFNGTNTRISTNFFPEGYRSYFIWVNYRTLTHSSGYQLTGTQEANAFNYIGIQNGGAFYYYMGTNGGAVSGTVLSAGVWYYQGLTLSSDGNARAYLNDALVDTRASGIGARATLEFSVGAINQNYWIDGNIAMVTQYGRALTQAEVAQNYNATRWRFGV